MDWEIKPSRAHKPDPKKPKKSQKKRYGNRISIQTVHTVKRRNINKKWHEALGNRYENYMNHLVNSNYFDIPKFIQTRSLKFCYKVECREYEKEFPSIIKIDFETSFKY